MEGIEERKMYRTTDGVAHENKDAAKLHQAAIALLQSLQRGGFATDGKDMQKCLAIAKDVENLTAFVELARIIRLQTKNG